MSFDDHKDLAYSTIPVGGAPSPATTGNSLKVASAADRALFPTPPFQATVWPPQTSPLSSNAEIVQINGYTGTDGFVMARAQGDSTAKAIVAGWQIAATVTKKPFDDLESGLSAKTTVTIGTVSKDPGADYVTDGLNDEVQFQAACDYLKTLGGGRILIKKGTYKFYTTVTNLNLQNVAIEGESYGGVIFQCNYAPTGAAELHGLLVFRGSTTPAAKNISIKNIWVDHNGYTTNGFLFRAVTTGSDVSSNFLVERCEFYNRKGDSSGAEGSILIYGSYSAATGTCQNIRIKNCVFRDNQAPATNLSHASIRFLCNVAEDVYVEDNVFQDLYGATILLTAGGPVRGRKNFNFKHNTFKRTKKGTFTSTVSDIFDSGRYGFIGIHLDGNYYNDEAAYTFDEDKFSWQIYNSFDFVVSNERYYQIRSVGAPGLSFPAGNESVGWTFSDNLMYECKGFLDSDGHYAGTYDNNVFIRTDIGRIFWGYGNHNPNVFSNNLLYDCGANPESGPEEYKSCLFLMEQAGQIVENNTIFTENVRPKYIFFEADGGSGVNEPNYYTGNKILGNGATSYTFALHPNFSHIIHGNYGVTENIIQNRVKNGTFAVLENADLVTSDVVANNYKVDRTPIDNGTRLRGLKLRGTKDPKLSASGEADIYYNDSDGKLYYRDGTGALWNFTLAAGTSTSTSSTSTSSTSTSSTSTSSTSSSTSISTSSTSISTSSTSISTSSTSISTSSTSHSTSSTSHSTSSTSSSHSTSSTSTSTTVIAFG